MIWKQRLGSRGTYCELISIFERTRFHDYADNVKRIMHVSENKADDFSGDFLFPSPQPQTYPHHEPCCPPESSQLSSHKVSEWEEYMHIDSQTGEYVHKGIPTYWIYPNNV